MPGADDVPSPTSTEAPSAVVTAPPRQTPKTAAPAKAGGPAADEAAPSLKMRRRIIWSCVWGFLAANFLMFLRFFFPRALFEPTTIFHIGYPADYPTPGVYDQWKPMARIWVVREATRIYVIYARCVHLGCTPDWKPSENKFKCPCHGSGYTPQGINFEGPAPRPMDRARVELDAQGQIVVDTSKLYLWPKGGRDEFNDPGAFIPV